MRQIPATDTACEQDIAADQQRVFPGKKAQASRAVTWHFQNLHLKAEKIARGRRFNQEIWLNRIDLQFEPKAPEEISIRNHRRGFRVTPDPAIKAPFYLGDIRDVVEMAVREQEQLRHCALRDQPVTTAIGRVE